VILFQIPGAACLRFAERGQDSAKGSRFHAQRVPRREGAV
jgi:hypothetical protein